MNFKNSLRFALVPFVLLANLTSISAQTKLIQENEQLKRQVLILRSKVDSLETILSSLPRTSEQSGVINLWDLLSDEQAELEELREEDGFFDASETLEEMLSRRLAKIDFRLRIDYNENLHKYITFYTRQNKRMKRVSQKYAQLQEGIESAFRKEGVPLFVAPLCIVESACSATAVSKAGAVGLWQFMPETAAEYGLKVDRNIDERCHMVKSTEAAAKYLKALYRMFNDWRMAISAYNCGPERVRQAVKKAGSNNFWDYSQYLPKETQAYMPSLIAVTYYLDYYAE